MMIAIGLAGPRSRRGRRDGTETLPTSTVLKIAATGSAVGILSGFFGLGGSFLIVPGPIVATGMPMISAVGTSLASVGVLSLTATANYARSDLVDWQTASEFVA